MLVFPTLVGVFLSRRPPVAESRCLPHARGGVSKEWLVDGVEATSSPRSWGCFRHQRGWLPGHRVFPTLVGVFPRQEFYTVDGQSLPHARGGVSMYITSLEVTRESSPRSWGCFQSHPRNQC